MTPASVWALYRRTVPRDSALHLTIRALARSGCSAAVAVLSKLTRFELPPEDGLALYALAMLTRTYEKSSLELCRKVLPKGGIAIDVGAHAGYFSLALARAAGREGRVIACEPCERTFPILERNLRRKRAGNVVPWKLAVGAMTGIGTLHLSRQSPGHSLLAVKEFVATQPVEIITIDDLVRRYAFDHVDLIKIDAEGAEPDVLDGMEECRRRSPRLSVLFEYKPEYLLRRGCHAADLYARLTRLGLIPFAVGPKGQCLRADSELCVPQMTPPFNMMALTPAVAAELGAESWAAGRAAFGANAGSIDRSR